MIGEAIYDLLKNNGAIADLIDGRVTSIAFPQKGKFPAITYNVRKAKTAGCRDMERTKKRILEIAILANNSVELEEIADTTDDVLDGYEGIHQGYALSIQAIEDDFDEKVEDLTAYYKAQQYEVNATKQ